MGRVNNIIIGLEIIGILFPVSILLFFLGIPAALKQSIFFFNLDEILIVLVSITSAAVTISVWLLAIKYLRGISVINKRHMAHWALVVTGFIIVIAAFLLSYLIQPKPFSGFYGQLTMFIFGAPLLVPAVHVFMSAWVNDKR